MAACLFSFEMPSTMLIRLGSPLVSVNRVFGAEEEEETETEAVRLWPDVAFGGGVGSRDTTRLRGKEFCRPREA